MKNQVTLIGRLTNDVKVNETETGKKIATCTLAVQRDYRNEEGAYETDFFPVTLFGSKAETTSEYCHKGDLIGVEGQLKMRENNLEVVGDRVIFLHKSKNHEEDKDEAVEETKEEEMEM